MPAARRKKKKGPPVSGRLLLLQLALFAAILWLTLSEWAPLTASDSPVRLLLSTSFFMLLAWAGAFGMTLWTYMAISLDDFFDLLGAAMRGSVHAVWIVPAMLMVMTPALPAVVALGILLIVNTARMLVANPPPQRRLASRQALRSTHRLFGEARVKGGMISKETSPCLLGALALQAGLFAAWIGYSQWAALLLAASVASVTWSSMARGAYQPRRRQHVLHTILSVAMALFLSTSLSLVRQGDAATLEGESGNALEATRREVRQLVNPEPPKPAAAAAPPKKRAVALAAPTFEADKLGKGGIPGLILHPTKKQAQSLTIPPAYRLQVTLSPSRPVSIPFTGEYHLFRESSEQLPPGAELRDGSPMDAVYATTNGSSMETDAYQDFDPPVDFSPCGRIKMTLLSGELFPASATLVLLGAVASFEAGPEIFGLGGAGEETIEFAVSPIRADARVKAIRIIFRHNPMQASHSTRVAIQGFTFLPRGL
jgi:hypothetical protein